MSHVTCHVSRVTCYVSHFTCHMSHSMCHMSQFYFFIFFRTKCWSLAGEGLLSTGPTPSSFKSKSWFKIFEITIELYCNLKNLKLWFSHENIDKINFSLKTYPPPQMLLFCIFWYTLDQYWSIFLAKNKIYFFFSFPSIIKSMLSLYKLWKIITLSISVH